MFARTLIVAALIIQLHSVEGTNNARNECPAVFVLYKTGLRYFYPREPVWQVGYVHIFEKKPVRGSHFKVLLQRKTQIYVILSPLPRLIQLIGLEMTLDISTLFWVLRTYIKLQDFSSPNRRTLHKETEGSGNENGFSRPSCIAWARVLDLPVKPLAWWQRDLDWRGDTASRLLWRCLGLYR